MAAHIARNRRAHGGAAATSTRYARRYTHATPAPAKAVKLATASAIAITSTALASLWPARPPVLGSTAAPPVALASSGALIGITSYAQPARWGAWELPAALVPFHYVESVERAGGRALVVPPSTEAVDETLDVLDGVIFSGGIDSPEGAPSPRGPSFSGGSSTNSEAAERRISRIGIRSSWQW